MDSHQQRGGARGRPLSAAWTHRPSPARERADHLVPSWSASLDPDPGAPALARRALDPFEAHLGWETMENVRLLATELVTNSVVHADGAPGSIQLVAHLFADLAVVTVSDQGAGFDPLTLHGSLPGEPGGRGLELVALLADDLGIDCRVPFRVWFAILR